MSVWQILKSFRPDVKWYGNDVSYEYSGGGFEVSCEQLGEADYRAIVKVGGSCRELVGRGKTCEDALANALHDQ